MLFYVFLNAYTSLQFLALENAFRKSYWMYFRKINCNNRNHTRGVAIPYNLKVVAVSFYSFAAIY